MERLGKETGLGEGDLIISCTQNEKEDVSRFSESFFHLHGVVGHLLRVRF